MIGNYKNIHIGKLIAQRMQECDIEVERAAKFLAVTDDEIERMYTLKSIDSHLLLRWSKLLKYDFFRIYSQHLILYAPQHTPCKGTKEIKTALPVLKKNVYTQEVILYLIELVESEQKTGRQIQEEYNIPATTILRWINKHKKVRRNEYKQQTLL